MPARPPDPWSTMAAEPTEETMMNLVAVTASDTDDTDLHHAAVPGDDVALCGAHISAPHRASTRFLAATGSLCGRCVDRALVRRVEKG
jgi:hypothetical protein